MYSLSSGAFDAQLDLKTVGCPSHPNLGSSEAQVIG